MTNKYTDTNKYFTVIVLGIITFLNSDLYFSNIVTEGNQDMIDGINSITKFLLIVTVLFLLTQIPYNKVHQILFAWISWPFIKLSNIVRKKKSTINTAILYEYMVSIFSNLGYIILFGGFIFYIFLV